jgi:xylulokinase
VDVGGSSTKAAAFTVEGKLLARGRSDYRPFQPSPDVAEYDARELCQSAVRALAEVGRHTDLGRAEVLAVDAMVSGVVAIDMRGDPVSVFTTNLDARANRHLEGMLSNCGADIVRLTGSSQATLASKIMWIREQFPDVASSAAKYVTAGSLVTGFLAGSSGEEFVIDPTCLWSTGLSEAATERWSPQLCEYAELDTCVLPIIVPSARVVGHVAPGVAADTGLRSGTPIVAGCADQAAGLLGAGVVGAGTVAETTGTYGALSCMTEAFLPGVTGGAAGVVGSLVPGLWTVQSAVIGSGLTREWASELLATANTTECSSGESLEESAGAVAVGADHLLFVPHLGGQMCPSRPQLRGAWVGLTWAHGAGHLYRAVLEAFAYEIAHSLQAMAPACPDRLTAEPVIIYGGGARSDLWNQIRSDVVGLPYESLGDAPVTELGAAVLGGYGVGLIEDLTVTGRSRRKVIQRYSPDSDRHALYLGIIDQYISCIDAVLPVCEDLQKLS